MPKEQLSVWAVPSAKNRHKLESSIRDLVESHHAPFFTPHVTLFVAQVPFDEMAGCTAFLGQTNDELHPFTLESQKVDESDFFWKTLFIQFGMTDELMNLYERLRNEFGKYAEKPDDIYKINPHLSLLYKDIPQTERQRMAASYTPPQTIEFDTLGYNIQHPHTDPFDIPHWDIQILEKRG